MGGWGFGLPEEFKNLTKEQLLENYKAGQEALSKLPGIEAENQTLKNNTEILTSSVEEIKNKMAALEVGLTEEGRGNRQQQHQQGDNNNQPKLPDWAEDADAAFNARVNARLQPLAVGMLMQQATIAKRDAIDRIISDSRRSVVYKKLRSECENLFNQLSPQQKVDSGAYETCVDIIFSRNFEKLSALVNKETGTLDLESSSSDTSQREERPIVLSEDQKKIARSFGMTDKEYAEYSTAAA